MATKADVVTGPRSLSGPVTQATKALAPFINARLNHNRDAKGYVIPRSQFVDIRYRGADRIDADIRGVTSAGVRSYFISASELICWEDIERITLRGDGCAVVVYERDPETVDADRDWYAEAAE